MANSTNPPNKVDDPTTVAFAGIIRQEADHLVGGLASIQTRLAQYSADNLAANLPGTGIPVEDGAGSQAGDPRQPVTDQDMLDAVAAFQLYVTQAQQPVREGGPTVAEVFAKFCVNPQNFVV